MEYVQSRYIKNPDTIFRNIRKLPPGYSLTFEDSGLQIKKYWDIEDFTKLHQMDDQSALEELERAMEESVKLRMISDVPFGAFLSGGLDSSLVVALMSQYSDYPVNTFSVGFNDPEHSELPYARTIADLFKTNHHELVITHKDIMDNLYEAVWHRDAPVSETADIPMMLLSKEAKKSVSVILTGEGSDEVFGGYPKYAYDHLAKSMVYRNLFKNRLASYVVNHLPYGFRKVKSAYNTLLEEDDLKRYDRWFASYRRENVTGLFSREYLIHHGNKEGRQIKIKGSTNLDMMLYYDIKYWLSDNLLERGDKMLMAGSIEGRLPFLDFNLVELAFRFDDRLKIRKMNRKFIIKRLAQKYIPEKIINRKKVGFYIPIGDWFRKDLKDFVYDHLLSSKFSQRGIFNGEEVKRIVDLHCGSKVNYEKEIWMLLNLEIWFRRFID